MTLKKWIKTPKGYVAIAMFAFLIIAAIGYKDSHGIKNAFTAVFAGVIVDIILNIIKRRKWTLPEGAVITGLIIALILSTATSILVVGATAVFAILSKHFLVYKKKPIFNPAAFGLLFSFLFFKTGQSWWGAFGDLSVWTILFLLVGGYMVANRIHKFPQVFSFLGTTFVMLALMGYFNIGDAVDALRPPFINGTLFFAFFMLTDPPTSPAKDKDQVIFGFLTAAAGTLVYAAFGGLIYLFIGLCLGNLYTYLKKRSVSKSMVNRKGFISTHR
ncbi:RnfABCDGE type electron transport complex subunit D [Neobacillus terrae]|uniref:RnfABCDGE type electron transport complex subunit D n=1 Tax=Neobacillus terrae TaxID=3034837 RepID=UPI0014080270|nr:RnfABCDGE type electron transport complex subunit D [Neobacillus terrae]NHM32031.1 RnfABCDGE type electron transport complex subunit D [Neobacillus terrae]